MFSETKTDSNITDPRKEDADLGVEMMSKQVLSVPIDSGVLIFRPRPNRASTSTVNTGALSQFLGFVAEGEQGKAELMLQNNPVLGFVPGTLKESNSGRTFEGITGLQYAVWALNWRIWNMLLRYLPAEEVKRQSEQFVSGLWVRAQGVDAGPHLKRLIDALKSYIDQFDKLDWPSREAFWRKQVGSVKLLLPVHVIHECYPPKCSRSMRSSDQMRGGRRGKKGARSEYSLIASLYNTGIQQRDRLINKLSNQSTLQSTHRIKARP